MEPQYLNSPKEAIEVGFLEGCRTRKYRDSDHDKYIESDRELNFETPYPLRRGDHGMMYYKEWRLGFDAGYLGRTKPTLA